jgi:cytochrome c oxidase assembly protein subunit 15
MSTHKQIKLFLKIGTITLVSIYLLILIGGIVRSTGAGMGCPDWPKCFGSWIPPLHESQLPENYQDIYSHRGYKNTTFNVFKTWTEYLNRLSGVVVGLLIIATWIASFPLFKISKKPFFLTLLAVILVGFQGWLGSMVVKSNLTPWIITAHMIVALLLLALMIYTLKKPEKETLPKKLKYSLFLALCITALQILLGTQVREKIDVLALSSVPRQEWIQIAKEPFIFHREMAIVVLIVNLWIGLELIKSKRKNTGIQIISIMLFEFLLGLILAYLSLPAYAQPLHLLLGILLFGTQFNALIRGERR